MSNDPRDMDGKRLQQAMRLFGRDTALRARMVNFLRECEPAIAYEGAVRDDIIGPIVDALHEDTDTYDKELADGTRLQFYYRTKIARDLLLSAGERPEHVWEPQTTKLLLALAPHLQGDVLVGGAYFGDQAVLVARALVDKGMKVHCFEPNPEQAGMLEHNVALNHLGNVVVNRIRSKLGLPYWSLSMVAKHKVKNAVQFIGRYEEVVAHAARSRGVDGVVCGHIHSAEMREIEGVNYYNDGDWVEGCTALVEHHDGRMEILHWAQEVAARNTPAQLSLPAPAKAA